MANVGSKRKEEEDNSKWLDPEYRKYIPEEVGKHFEELKKPQEKHCWDDCDDVGCNNCLGSQ